MQILAKKIVMLCRLASEQLTKHCHYDWGLRSLRSVLNVASQMRQQQPGLPEAVILIRSLHDVNLSKLVFEDVPLFLGIIKVSRIWHFSVHTLSLTAFTFVRFGGSFSRHRLSPGNTSDSLRSH